MNDITWLRQELKQRGWDRKATGRVLLELALHLGVALSGITLFIISDSIFVGACAMVVSTAGSMGVGTNAHTSSHYGTSNRKWVNEILSFFGFSVFLGLSASYWRYMHVIRHHPAPNVIGVDMDHDLMPWFCIIKKEMNELNGLRRFYYERLQWAVFPFALAVNGFTFQIAGWRYLLAVLRNPQQRKKLHWIDLGALLRPLSDLDRGSHGFVFSHGRTTVLSTSNWVDGLCDVCGPGPRPLPLRGSLPGEGSQGAGLRTEANFDYTKLPDRVPGAVHLLWFGVSDRASSVPPSESRPLSKNEQPCEGILSE